MRRRSILTTLLTASLAVSGLAVGLAPTSVAAASPRTTGLAAGNPFCQNLGVKYQASAGAQMFCFGVQRNGAQKLPLAASTPGNVNAANLAEDVSPSGIRGYGQSETSIAASGKYVVEAWNDSTQFFAACPSPSFKEEGTGLGFSADGGKTFTDLGGLPNLNCAADLYQGDPSVAAYTAGGSTYFYISSLFNSPTGLDASFIALDACKAAGSGTTATLSCGQPVTVASSSACAHAHRRRPDLQLP